MMTEAPTPSELSRRLDRQETQLSEGFAQLNLRLDSFPTEATIVALFQVRDTQIASLQAQLIEAGKDLDEERRARENGDKDIEIKADQARRWTIGAIIAGVASSVALLGFLLDLSGAVAK